MRNCGATYYPHLPCVWRPQLTNANAAWRAHRTPPPHLQSYMDCPSALASNSQHTRFNKSTIDLRCRQLTVKCRKWTSPTSCIIGSMSVKPWLMSGGPSASSYEPFFPDHRNLGLRNQNCISVSPLRPSLVFNKARAGNCLAHFPICCVCLLLADASCYIRPLASFAGSRVGSGKGVAIYVL